MKSSSWSLQLEKAQAAVKTQHNQKERKKKKPKSRGQIARYQEKNYCTCDPKCKACDPRLTQDITANCYYLHKFFFIEPMLP